jgi:Domain of unknown function (DUF4232)
MRAGARTYFRLVTMVAFGATATLAILLSANPGQGGTVLGAASANGSASASGSANGGGQPLAVAAPACPSSGLRIFVGPGNRVTAAVTRYALDFTNVSRASCALTGYPQVAAYRGDGEQVGASATHDTSVAAGRVLLAPGQTAHASLDAARALPGCRPVRASGLRVIVAPGQPPIRYVRPLTACAAADASGQDYLRVRAIQAGSGSA